MLDLFWLREHTSVLQVERKVVLPQVGYRYIYVFAQLQWPITLYFREQKCFHAVAMQAISATKSTRISLCNVVEYKCAAREKLLAKQVLKSQ